MKTCTQLCEQEGCELLFDEPLLELLFPLPLEELLLEELLLFPLFEELLFVLLPLLDPEETLFGFWFPELLFPPEELLLPLLPDPEFSLLLLLGF